MQASPGSSTHFGVTPRTPDDGALVAKPGAPRQKTREEQLRERRQVLMERVRKNGAKRKHGNSFDKPMTTKDASHISELVRIRETHGGVSLGSLDSLRTLGRPNDDGSPTPDYAKLIQERNSLYQQNIKRVAKEIRKQEIGDAYIDILTSYEESEWPQQPIPRAPTQRSDSRGKPAQPGTSPNPTTLLARYVELSNLHHNDIRERLDHAHAKTVISLAGTAKDKNNLAQKEAKLKAERLDKVPLTYEAWKNLDEGRQFRVGRFLQLPDEQKDTEVTTRKWNREDAMALYQLYKNEPEFHAAVDAVVSKRTATDPRRRPTLSNAPAPVEPK